MQCLSLYQKNLFKFLNILATSPELESRISKISLIVSNTVDLQTYARKSSEGRRILGLRDRRARKMVFVILSKVVNNAGDPVSQKTGRRKCCKRWRGFAGES